MNEYRIPSSNWAALQARLARLNADPAEGADIFITYYAAHLNTLSLEDFTSVVLFERGGSYHPRIAVLIARLAKCPNILAFGLEFVFTKAGPRPVEVSL